MLKKLEKKIDRKIYTKNGKSTNLIFFFFKFPLIDVSNNIINHLLICVIFEDTLTTSPPLYEKISNELHSIPGIPSMSSRASHQRRFHDR